MHGNPRWEPPAAFLWMEMPNTTISELLKQWANPGDVLSLLLLIGGSTVQKSIAQLVGFSFHPNVFGRSHLSIDIAPVAFSFGWVAYGFTSLLSAVGERRLMPVNDSPSIVVNCANGFTRSNQSWVLGRLLRDLESEFEVDATNPADGELPSRASKGRAESIRIDIFETEIRSEPRLDGVWWLGWATIALQVGIGAIPWAIYGDWGVMMVVLCGNALALLTTTLPQWRQEKWPGRTLESESTFCLTRGNGYLNVIVLICPKGSWNIETLATANSIPRPETPYALFILAVCWTCILISVSGLKSHAWFLVGIGGVGMLQNVHAAGAARHQDATAGFNLKRFSRKPTIIGKRQMVRDDLSPDVDLKKARESVSVLDSWQQDSSNRKMPKWLETMDSRDGAPSWLEAVEDDSEIANVHGALMELEKWVPTAGIAMLQTYFPAGLEYNDSSIRDNMDKRFWKRAYETKVVRRKAERARRKLERDGVSSVKQEV